jgi:hypothetical protein
MVTFVLSDCSPLHYGNARIITIITHISCYVRGRRPLLLLGATGVVLSLTALALTEWSTFVDMLGEPNSTGWFSASAMILFLISFQVRLLMDMMPQTMSLGSWSLCGSCIQENPLSDHVGGMNQKRDFMCVFMFAVCSSLSHPSAGCTVEKSSLLQ